MTKGGVKWDRGKLSLLELPWDVLLEVAAVMNYGAIKYNSGNWKKGMPQSRYLDPALRHILQHWFRQDIEPDMGCAHLAHAICCLLMAFSNLRNGRGADDRPPPEECAAAAPWLKMLLDESVVAKLQALREEMVQKFSSETTTRGAPEKAFRSAPLSDAASLLRRGLGIAPDCTRGPRRQSSGRVRNRQSGRATA